MKENEIIEAYQELRAFIAKLSAEELKRESKSIQLAEVTALHYYALIKDYNQFDIAVSTAEKKYLYSDEILPLVYETYIERKLHVVALDHLKKAKAFYKELEEDLPAKILEIDKRAPDEETIKTLKGMMESLSSQSPFNIPKIIPDAINDQNNLDDFILNEIVKASREMLLKIKAVSQITHENKYNDLLISLLRLRLPIWGWEILDETRVQSSNTKKDSGHADFLIKCSGDSIALWEAFILRDFSYTKDHILRCKKYASFLDRYYVIIYHLAPNEKLDENWSNYQNDVLRITYPPNFKMDKTKGFESLGNTFKNIQHVRLAKTFHNTSIEMFHIMIDIGPPDDIEEVPKKASKKKTTPKKKPKRVAKSLHTRKSRVKK